jgi:hypothetical protein
MNEIIETHKIERFEIQVTKEAQKQYAELVGFLENGDEIRFKSKVYVHGEYHDIETDIICTTNDGKSSE